MYVYVNRFPISVWWWASGFDRFVFVWNGFKSFLRFLNLRFIIFGTTGIHWLIVFYYFSSVSYDFVVCWLWTLAYGLIWMKLTMLNRRLLTFSPCACYHFWISIIFSFQLTLGLFWIYYLWSDGDDS